MFIFSIRRCLKKKNDWGHQGSPGRRILAQLEKLTVGRFPDSRQKGWREKDEDRYRDGEEETTGFGSVYDLPVVE